MLLTKTNGVEGVINAEETEQNSKREHDESFQVWLVLTRITVFPARPEFRRIAVFDRLIRESDLSHSSSTDLEPIWLGGGVESDLNRGRTGRKKHWTELRLDGDTAIPAELVADARLTDVDLRVEVI